MPTTYGTKTLKKDVRKRSKRIDMDRLAELASYTDKDGKVMSHQEIADRMGCERVTVTRALQRVPEWNIRERTIEDFKQNRADTLAGAQQLILKYITPDKLKAASLQQLGTLFGIFYDKERLERGKATQHVANVTISSLDENTRKLIQRAISSRTNAMLEDSKVSVEPVDSTGDSVDAEVDTSFQEE